MIHRLDGQPYTPPKMRQLDMIEGQVFGCDGSKLEEESSRFLVLRGRKARNLNGWQPCDFGLSQRVFQRWGLNEIDETVGRCLDGQLRLPAGL